MSRIRIYTSVALLLLLAGYAGYLSERFLRARSPELRQQNPPQLLVSDPAVLDQARITELNGKLAPEFTLPDVSGAPRLLSEWAGRVRVLNFWATWCGPCLREIPGLIDLQTRYGDTGLQIIGIALQSPEEVAGFLDEQGMNYPVLTGESEVIKIAESLGNTAGVVPYTVILDRQGAIRFLRHGELDMKVAEAEIKRLLE